MKEDLIRGYQMLQLQRPLNCNCVLANIL